MFSKKSQVFYAENLIFKELYTNKQTVTEIRMIMCKNFKINLKLTFERKKLCKKTSYFFVNKI